MSKMDALIEEFCPDGVEMRKLSDLAVLLPGLKGKSKADFSGGNARYVTYRTIYSNPGLNQKVSDFVRVRDREEQNSIKLGDILITGSSESLADVGMSSVVTSVTDEPIYVNSFCFIVRPVHDGLIDPNFAKHLFRSEFVRDQIRRTANGVTRINISKPRFMQIRLPVPPLPVQHEIVRILDMFTQLEAELEAELEARKQQYDHYRRDLLDFSNDGTVKWSTLGEIALSVSSGGTPSSQNSSYYGGHIPWLRTQEVDFNVITSTGMTITEEGLKNSSAKWIPANSVIVAMYGATAAKTAVSAIPLTTNQACCNLQIDPLKAEFRYVFHWISNCYQQLRNLGEGSQNNINSKKVKSFPIALPSLEAQKSIVSILDNFDSLVYDISAGLPAEIEARRKQYEYYRDKLLTFEELSA